MKVETIAGGRLRVWLSQEETEKWGLFHRDEEGPRRLVRQVMHRAGMPWRRPLTAEVFPVEEGCVMLISSRRERENGPCVYHLDSVGALCALADSWCRLPSQPIQLYQRGDGYDLAADSLSDAHRRLLAEYGRPVGMGLAAPAAAAEHGRWLGDERALRQLGITAPVPPSPAPEGQEHETGRCP